MYISAIFQHRVTLLTSFLILPHLLPYHSLLHKCVLLGKEVREMVTEVTTLTTEEEISKVSR